MANNYSLVTGASSGIGKAIAEELAKNGNNVILLARRKDLLDRLSEKLSTSYNVKTVVLTCDLSEKSSPNYIYEFCKKNNLNVDLLVNNAGYLVGNQFHLTEEEDEDKAIRVMCNHSVHLTKYFLNDMRIRKSGRIMIISSIAAFIPPSNNWSMLYSASKSFLVVFGEALNMSYRKEGITTTVVLPGYTISELHEQGGIQNIMNNVPNYMKKSAKYVAKKAVKSTFKGKYTCTPGRLNKLILLLLKTIPNSWVIALSGKMTGGRYKD
jgi:short-subunit dehydrogenase